MVKTIQLFQLTSKKELIGNYKNNGQELCKKGMPTKVQGHDRTLGRHARITIFC